MMVIFSFGLPSGFAEWCDAIISRLADRILGEAVLVSANTPEELAAAMVNTEVRHVVVSSRQPGQWLRQLLSEPQKRFIIALDDPRAAVSNLVERHQVNWLEATRVIGRGCASITQCLAFSGGLVLRANSDSPRAIALAIARHVGLAVADEEIEGIVADLDADLTESMRRRSSEWAESIPESGLAVVNGALAAYIDGFSGNPVEQIIWARDLFFAENHQPAVNAIEITGRSRYVIYGPYITLLPGHWTAEVILGFSQEAVDINFIIEVFSGKQLTSASIRPQGEGILPVALNFDVDDDSPVEIRIMNERAAFEGRVALLLVSLSSQKKIPEDVLKDWARELGLYGPKDGQEKT